MNAETVKEFQKAVSTADWKLDLYKFAAAVGQDPTHSHTQELFRQLSGLNKAINKFDAATLSAILNAT